MEPIIMSALTFCMLYGPTCVPCPYIRDADTTIVNSTECCCPETPTPLTRQLGLIS